MEAIDDSEEREFRSIDHVINEAIGMSFTMDQKIETSIGDPIEIDRKNIVYGGIGVEY